MKNKSVLGIIIALSVSFIIVSTIAYLSIARYDRLLDVAEGEAIELCERFEDFGDIDLWSITEWNIRRRHYTFRLEYENPIFNGMEEISLDAKDLGELYIKVYDLYYMIREQR